MARMPANADELLELRALNDAPTEAIASLPAAAAKARGRGRGPPRASGPQMVALLRDAVAGGKPLQEECVLERMAMAVVDVEATPGAGAGMKNRRIEEKEALLLVYNNRFQLPQRLHTNIRWSRDPG